MNKLRTTFADSIRNHAIGDRVHCLFHQLRSSDDNQGGKTRGPRFGRTSSTDPNLQQQPSREDYAAVWRSIYVPDNPEQMWLSADYSQQEPRILTHYAEACRLPGASAAAERYRRDPNTDNHSMMTKLVYPDLDESSGDWKKRRFECKQNLLGLCYGKGGAKFARDLGLPTVKKKTDDGREYLAAGPEAQAILDIFNEKVPYVKRLSRKCQNRAAEVGYILTILNRRCRFPLKPDGTYDWLHKALNRLIQGSAADQTKRAMVEIYRAGLPIQLQVHDEIDASIDSLEQAYAIGEIMETCVPMSVPSKVDLEVGPSWGEAKLLEAA